MAKLHVSLVSANFVTIDLPLETPLNCLTESSAIYYEIDTISEISSHGTAQKVYREIIESILGAEHY